MTSITDMSAYSKKKGKYQENGIEAVVAARDLWSSRKNGKSP